MAGKGDKRRKESFGLVQKNWDEIDFRPRNSYCFECNSSIKPADLKENPENYIFHKDGYVSHKNGCNFN